MPYPFEEAKGQLSFHVFSVACPRVWECEAFSDVAATEEARPTVAQGLIGVNQFWNSHDTSLSNESCEGHAKLRHRPR